MAKTGRPSFWAKYRDEMVRLYVDEKWSRGQVARHFDTTSVTVTRQLSAAGVTFESRIGDNPNDSRTPADQARIAAKISQSRKGKGTGSRVKRETRTCEECQREYVYRSGQTGERYCSRACSLSAQTRGNTKGAQEAYALDPRLCPCGDPIDYGHRNTRQFCSPECRKTYSIKRQPNPTNHVTFACQHCGAQVSRYRKYGNGALKFCSNACAMKHTRTVKHYVVRDLDMVLDSTWEVLFAGLCGFLKLPCERYDRTRGVEWDGPDSWYAPDFWLPTLGLAVEIKGLEDDGDPARWEVYRARGGFLAQGGFLVVLDHAELDRLRTSDDGELFASRLTCLCWAAYA